MKLPVLLAATLLSLGVTAEAQPRRAGASNRLRGESGTRGPASSPAEAGARAYAAGKLSEALEHLRAAVHQSGFKDRRSRLLLAKTYDRLALANRDDGVAKQQVDMASYHLTNLAQQGDAIGEEAKSLLQRRRGKDALERAVLVYGMVLARGDQGQAVKELQRRIKVQVNGQFGPTTEAVLESVQQKRRVAQTGKVGPTTLQALGVEVIYGRYRVSDAKVRGFLERLSARTGQAVVLTSGDRDFVPRGGSRNSLHLQKRAADFYVEGQTLRQTWEVIRRHRGELLGDSAYEVIWHDVNTNTGGPHLHVGRHGYGTTVFLYENYGNYRQR